MTRYRDFQSGKVDMARHAERLDGWPGASNRDPRLEPEPPLGRVPAVRSVPSFPALRSDFNPAGMGPP